MTVRYNENTPEGSEISGDVSKMVDFTEEGKAEVKFTFWWDVDKKELFHITHGVIIFEGRELAYYSKFGNMGNWKINEHRDNFPAFSDIMSRVIDELKAELLKENA